MIDLRNAVDKKQLPETKNPDKVIDIVEKILDFASNNKLKDSKYQ